MKKNHISAVVSQIKPLTNAVMQVFLELPSPVEYDAGEYLEVVTSDGQHVPFSIANAHLGSSQIELHIRHMPENRLNNQVVAEIQQQGSLTISMPFGQCTYHLLKPELPIIFMARGTGFAPIKAIIEQLLANASNVPMHLYWGARNIGDHYLSELPEKWATSIENFTYTPLLCPEEPNLEISEKWHGRTGDLIDSIAMDHYPNLSDYQVLAAGPFDMMIKARDVFQKQGLNRENMYSDAFELG